MKYTVDSWVFEKNPNVCFGIIIGKNIKNSNTMLEDDIILANAEENIRKKITDADLKTYPAIAIYRESLENVGINPNKYINSVEAMIKRVVKGQSLPRINALVDRCNAIALDNIISLGAHDLRDINVDLEVRLSREGDRFLPIGESKFEILPANELVFTSGSDVQTRQWLWRQSEIGKTQIDSQNLIFQLVGFNNDDNYEHFMNAIKEVEDLIVKRFSGEAQVYIVNSTDRTINF